MNRKLLIFAAILILLIVLILFLRRGDVNERSYPIFSIDSLAIGQIEVIDTENSLIVVPTKEGWRLTEPVQWDANKIHLENFFRDVIRARSAKTQMTTSEDAVQRYGLVPGSALQIKIWDKNQRLKEHVYFNNFGSNWDYFRYEDSSEIYQMRDLVSKRYIASLQEWRSPVLMRIFETEISSIEVSYGSNRYSLTHKDDAWIYRNPRVVFQIHTDNRPLLRLLNIIYNLDTMVFYDANTERFMPAFESPRATVILNLTDGTKRKLVFAETESKEYLLMLDDQPSPLYGVANDTILRFTIHDDYFRQLPYGSTPPPPVEE